MLEDYLVSLIGFLLLYIISNNFAPAPLFFAVWMSIQTERCEFILYLLNRYQIKRGFLLATDPVKRPERSSTVSAACYKFFREDIWCILYVIVNLDNLTDDCVDSLFSNYHGILLIERRKLYCKV
jgi:hypothetical protein